VFAIERRIIGDGQPALLPGSQENAADFGAAARQRKESVGHRQANVVQHAAAALDRKGHSGVDQVTVARSGWAAILLTIVGDFVPIHGKLRSLSLCT